MGNLLQIELLLTLILSWHECLAQQWQTIGNTATPGDFLGTINNQPLLMETNNTQRLLIDNGGTGNNAHIENTFIGSQSGVNNASAAGTYLGYWAGNAKTS